MNEFCHRGYDLAKLDARPAQHRSVSLRLNCTINYVWIFIARFNYFQSLSIFKLILFNLLQCFLFNNQIDLICCIKNCPCTRNISLYLIRLHPSRFLWVYRVILCSNTLFLQLLMCNWNLLLWSRTDRLVLWNLISLTLWILMIKKWDNINKKETASCLKKIMFISHYSFL